MGDRALIVFEDVNGAYSPATYLHWHGSHTLDLLKKALPRLRTGDHSYSAARFIGVCHTEIDGNLSLGVQDAPPDHAMKWTAEDWDEYYSPGDNGVFLVNVRTWQVRQFIGGECRASQLEMNLVGEEG